ncbi:MAG: ABC transporter ATP-binding protein/permease [Bacteroidota bacterium]|nr:ABC transporter ATP-binding protein/permease [Bacteroidota bacterium]MDX5429739.1 ABC transporter ATP-binding protein/permease [Bacteroidota bacterium]MDX5468518.1 ABC transporter ATP-binding protein/permease [Bacteroidota bacterium]
MKSLTALNQYFWKYRFRLSLGILFVVASTYFSVLQPGYVQQAIDVVAQKIKESQGKFSPELRNQLLHDTFILGLLILGAALLKGLFLFFMRQTIIVMSRHIEYDLKNEVFAQYQRLGMAFYRKNNTGDLMNRISEDVSRVRMYIGPAIMYTLTLIATFVFVIYKMVSVSPVLTLWVLIPLPVLSVSIYLVNNIIYRRSDLIQQKLSDMTTFVQEAFAGIRVLKAFGVGRDSWMAFEKENAEYQQKALSLAKFDALFFPLMMLLIGLSNLLVIYVGGKQVIDGALSFGNIAEFVIYVNMLTWPVASLGWVTSIVQRAAASQARINEFLAEEPEISNPSTRAFHFTDSIRFNEVSFSYGNQRQALQDISFELKKGEVLGVIGATGSGKSTLAALFLRLHDPSQGSIEIDGESIDTLNLDEYREHIGYVPQDVFLFSDTIAENIAFGLKSGEVEEELIIQAAKDAAVYENIQDFPKGFETMLGERGISLSGGQKQRVAIARALVKNPDLLILDDCLSAVDTRTEAEILGNFKKYLQQRTALIISHRVSSVMHADQIIVLEEGKIVEKGTHETLISLGGHYASLHEKQSLQEESALKAE